MDTVKILEVKQSIFASNDEQAEALRKELKKKKVFLLNLMSAPRLRQDHYPAPPHCRAEGRAAHRRDGGGY